MTTKTIPDINFKYAVVLIDPVDEESKAMPIRIVDGTMKETLEGAIAARDRMRKRAPDNVYEVFTFVKRG